MKRRRDGRRELNLMRASVAMLLTLVFMANRTPPIAAQVPTTERVLAALVDFLSIHPVDPSERQFTRTGIANLLVHNADSLKNFMWATSRNMVTVDFDILDWVTVSKEITDYPAQDPDFTFQIVQDIVSELSYLADLSQYDKVLLFNSGGPLRCAAYLVPVPLNTPNGTFTLGAAWVSAGSTETDSCVWNGRIAHEFGHTYGFLHSYLIHCGKEPPLPASLIDPTDRNDSCIVHYCTTAACTETYVSDSGITIGGGDWDMLGGDLPERYEEYFPLHFHATWQAHAGWLAEAQVTDARNAGQYVLTTLESLDPRPKAVRIPIGTNHRGDPLYYWLQTRVFSPWTIAHPSYGKPANFTPCQVDVRLQATGVFGPYGRSDSGYDWHTYFFNGFSTEISNGRERRTYGESVVRRNDAFHDPHRGILVEMVDCVAYPGTTTTEIDVSVSFSELKLDPPVAASFGVDRRAATVTLSNGGAAPVGIGTIALGGRHPQAFAVETDGCGDSVLWPGGACGVTVSYAGETVEGNPNHHGVLKIPNDDPLAPELSVALFGEQDR